jgi:hypothetical protein
MLNLDAETLFRIRIRIRGVQNVRNRIRPDPATTLLPTALLAPYLSVLSKDVSYCRTSYYAYRQAVV